MLNAFEFFIFHFTNYITNSSPAVFANQNFYNLEYLNADANSANAVYFVILESYLEHFVPISYQSGNSNEHSGLQQPSIWQSLSSTTSNLLHLRTPTSATKTNQSSSLFKSLTLDQSALKNQNIENYKQKTNLIQDPLGSEVWKCETMLLIIAEMWLNHNVPHFFLKKQQNFSPTHQNVFTPNSDHMRAVRILIKHLHYFVNSLNANPNNSMPICLTPIDEIKKSIWTPKYDFRKKLYLFFRLSFDRWPNDASFRLPLESWLSYIQPWRYTNSKEKDNEEFQMNRNASDNQIGNPVDWQWKQFISDNLLFYTVIFRQLISRFAKLLDLTSSKNALMLFRLAKVFSQQNLSYMIKEAEAYPFQAAESSSWSHGRSLLSPSIRNPHNITFKHPLIELEPATSEHKTFTNQNEQFEYIPLFSNATKSLIFQMLKVVIRAKEELTKIIDEEMFRFERASQASGFINSILSFFQMDDNFQTEDDKKLFNEKRKTQDHLDQALNRLAQVFEIPLSGFEFQNNDDSINDSNSFLRRRNINSPIQNSELISSVNGTPKLTPLGRERVLNKMYKPDVNIFEGNPDHQLVRSFEIAFLVQLTLFISSFINKKYGQQINDLYNDQGLLGIFFRHFITPPTTYIKIVRNGLYQPPNRQTEVLPPRINLRYLARKSVIFCTIAIFMIVRLFGYNFISFIFLSFSLFLIFIIIKSSFNYITNNTTHQ